HVHHLLPARWDRGTAAVTGQERREDPEQDAAELAAELRRVLLVSSRILRSHTASDEISASQYSVLASLQRAGESTPGAIAAFEHVGPPVMTPILGGLEAAGLMLGDAHPGDGRPVRVTLTDAGPEADHRGRRERDARLRSRVGATDQAERRTVWEAAQILHGNLVQRRD